MQLLAKSFYRKVRCSLELENQLVRETPMTLTLNLTEHMSKELEKPR